MEKTLLAVAMLVILTGSSFAFTNLTPADVKEKIDAGEDMVLLDVREPGEFEGGHIQGAINLPWTSGVLKEQYVDLPTDKPIIVICKSGGRSSSASGFLDGKGFDQILNMSGGMNAWRYGTVTFTDITVAEVKEKIDAGEDIVLLDVRDPGEFEGGHIQGAVNFPWTSGVLEEQYASLPENKPIIVICQSGSRSSAASAFLDAEGFDQVLNMLGGMNAWEYEIVMVEMISWGSIKAFFD